MSHHNHSESYNNNSNSNHRQQTPPSTCCSAASAELKLYQAFIFSVPIFFTFVLLLLFYLVYLRRRRLDWSSLQMRTSRLINNHIISSEMGLKKEVREMLPIIVFKESFSVTDTQCSVCLGEYEAEDRLQQIPACGHIFHMDCIDHWLSTHTTCPLCRLSLLPPPPTTKQPPPVEEEETSHGRLSPTAEENQSSSLSIHSFSHTHEDPPTINRDGQRISETGGAAAEIV